MPYPRCLVPVALAAALLAGALPALAAGPRDDIQCFDVEADAAGYSPSVTVCPPP